jgi:small GTP-binding protein
MLGDRSCEAAENGSEVVPNMLNFSHKSDASVILKTDSEVRRRPKEQNSTKISQMRSGAHQSRSDYNVRILLIGETGVGKSCLLYRYSEGEYKENFVLTHGIDYKEKNIEHMSHSIKMEIWDTTGNVKFRPLTNTCYKGVSGIILVYDVTDPNSF